MCIRDRPGAVLDKEGAEDFINDRYEFADNQGKPLEPDEIIIYDKEGNDITDKRIDLSKPGDYVTHVTVEDENGNSTTVDLDYIVKDPPEVEIKPCLLYTSTFSFRQMYRSLAL